MAGSGGISPSLPAVKNRRRALRLLIAGTLVLGMLVPLDVPRARPASAAGTAVTDQRIGVLPSFYPSEREFAGSTRPMWNRLAQAGADVGLVVIVENTVASIDYKDFVEREQGVGQSVLGTVSSAQTESAMLASATFQRTQFGIDGVLLRNYSGTCGIGNEPSPSLIQNLRSAGLTTIAVETLGSPGPCYGTLADVLLTFAGSYASYGSGPARPSWLTGASPRLWHVVFGVPAGQIAATVAASKASGVGADYVFATSDPGPVDATAVPDAGYWDALRTAVRGTGNTSTAVETFPTVGSQRLGIPVFGDANPSWGTVGTASTAELGHVVVNAANGPGTVVVPALLANINTAKAAGRRVLGYVPLGYTPTGGSGGSPPARSKTAILGDVTRWRDLYALDGIFLDEVQPECSRTVNGLVVDVSGDYAVLAADIRAAIPGVFLALNPGRNIGECFAAPFDAIVAFEGPASVYSSWTPSRWQDRYPGKQFWHLIYDASCPELSNLMRVSRQRNADLVYVTSQTGATLWTGTIDPEYFASLRSALQGTARCAAPSALPDTVVPRKPAPATPGPGTSAPRATVPPAPAPPPGAPSDEGITLIAAEPTARTASLPALRRAQIPPSLTRTADVPAPSPPPVHARLVTPVTRVST